MTTEQARVAVPLREMILRGERAPRRTAEIDIARKLGAGAGPMAEKEQES